ANIAPSAEYQSGAFAKGILEGYNTMDAMAGLAFGIIVVNSLKNLGLKSNEAIASSTIKAGVLSGIIMSVIYLMIILMGTMSMGIFPMAENGGIALSDISGFYFGAAGIFVLAGIATFACLKTAIGLVTSCSETFCQMFPGGPGYRTWACIFGAVSLLISNVGLTAIIIYAIPVLMFLYPLTITLTLLGLVGRWFDQSKWVYGMVTLFTAVAAFFDLLKALPESLGSSGLVSSLVGCASSYLPFFGHGFGWLVPAFVGLVLGLVMYKIKGE
uniref:branched-chain amino acid transport system II carrier protein n=1 Tax=Anaerovibrio sp. TaxID=1872532 RepID=UPI0025DDAE5B